MYLVEVIAIAEWFAQPVDSGGVVIVVERDVGSAPASLNRYRSPHRGMKRWIRRLPTCRIYCPRTYCRSRTCYGAAPRCQTPGRPRYHSARQSRCWSPSNSCYWARRQHGGWGTKPSHHNIVHTMWVVRSRRRGNTFRIRCPSRTSTIRPRIRAISRAPGCLARWGICEPSLNGRHPAGGEARGVSFQISEQGQTSNLSALSTLVHADTKSLTNFSFEPFSAYTSAHARNWELEPNTRSTRVPVHFWTPVARSVPM
jgi:hypothetical protein